MDTRQIADEDSSARSNVAEPGKGGQLSRIPLATNQTTDIDSDHQTNIYSDPANDSCVTMSCADQRNDSPPSRVNSDSAELGPVVEMEGMVTTIKLDADIVMKLSSVSTERPSVIDTLDGTLGSEGNAVPVDESTDGFTITESSSLAVVKTDLSSPKTIATQEDKQNVVETLPSCTVESSSRASTTTVATASRSGVSGTTIARRNPKKSLDQLHKQLLQKLLPTDTSGLDTDLPSFCASTSSALSSIPTSGVSAATSSTVQEIVSDTTKSSSADISLTGSSLLNEIRKEAIANVIENQVSEQNAINSNVTDVAVKNKDKGVEEMIIKTGPPTAARLAVKGVYVCAVHDCTCAYNQEADFVAHVTRSHSSLERLPCSFCYAELQDCELLAAHLKTHVRNHVRCAYCTVTCDTKEELAVHLASEHAGRAKKFNVCLKILNNERRRPPCASNAPLSSVERHGGKEGNSLAAIPFKDAVPVLRVTNLNDVISAKKSETSSKDCSNAIETNAKNETSDCTVASKSVGRKTRKAAKPMRIMADAVVTETVSIKRATIPMNIKCDSCTYTCNTRDEVHGHIAECHTAGSALSTKSLVCRICKMSTDDKAKFRGHIVHHPGNHMMRCYVCPYCSVSSTAMSVIEDHVTELHPQDAFRFEVQQESVVYLDGMMECPACRGAYQWKAEFISHLRAVHDLADLVANLDERFPDTDVSDYEVTKSAPMMIDGVSKSLFGDSLPRLEDIIALDDADGRVEESGRGCSEAAEIRWGASEGDLLNETRKSGCVVNSGSTKFRNANGGGASGNGVGSVCVERSQSNGRSVLVFHCDECPFTTNDFDIYTTHSREHGKVEGKATGSEGEGTDTKNNSIIRKLLTGSAGRMSLPDGAAEWSDGVGTELSTSFDSSSLSSSPALGGATAGSFVIVGGRKRAVVQHCHMCPFQTNKSVHFRRHLEIHERNLTITDGYSCGYCHFRHPRLNCIKFHLGKYHGDQPNKMNRIVDGQEIDISCEEFQVVVAQPLRSGPVGSPRGASTVDPPVLRTMEEKRPTVRYEPPSPTMHRTAGRDRHLSPGKMSTSAVGGLHSLDGGGYSDPVLTEFEKNLSMLMIYAEPVQCPRCDFTNRVRVNMLRHLRLHKEECADNFRSGVEGTEGGGEGAGDSNDGEQLMIDEGREEGIYEDQEDDLSVESQANEEKGVSNSQNKMAEAGSGTGGHSSLLRSILSERLPAASKAIVDDVGSGDSSDSFPPDSSSALVTSTRLGVRASTTISTDFLDYSTQLSRDRYQCKECPFVHRYPSKVKRHFFYKHSRSFPYRCGHCAFEAVESGKVRKHSLLVHRYKTPIIVKQRAEGNDGSGPGKRGGGGEVKVEGGLEVEEIKRELTTDEEEMQDVAIIDEIISREMGDGHGDKWMAQFVTRQEGCGGEQLCKLCGFVGRDKEPNLKRHIYDKHLRYYPYSCQYCGMATSDVGRVKKHIDRCHAGRPYVAVCRLFEDDLEASSDLVNGNRISREDQGDEHGVIDRHSSSRGSSTIKAEPMNYDEEDEDDEEAPQIDFYPSTSSTTAPGDQYNDIDEDGEFKESLDSVESKDVEGVKNGRTGEEERGWEETDEGVGSSRKRQFRCSYCGIVSRWNRRDIRLHILHVHMKRRVYTCRHCSFGNSKSRAVVKSHCVRIHPTRPVSIRDDVALLNMITPVEDRSGTVTVAFARPDGVPILEMDTLTRYLSRGQKSLGSGTSSSGSKLSTSNSCTETALTSPRSVRNGTKEPVVSGSGEGSSAVGGAGGNERWPWKCRQCSFMHTSVSRVKQHIVCYHMKLKPFSCPYCHLYIWKMQAVINHIHKLHPGREVQALNTFDEKSDFLVRNMEKVSDRTADTDRDRVAGDCSSRSGSAGTLSAASLVPAVYRCKTCGYEDVRNDKTKYHIVKTHLGLRQFSCPHCSEYMWGRHQVAKHIEEVHPGLEVTIRRTFHEYEEYLRENIVKIGGMCATNGNVSTNEKLGNDSRSATDEEVDGVEEGGEGTAAEEEPSSPLDASSSSTAMLKVQFNFRTPTKSSTSSISTAGRTLSVPRLPCNVCSFVTDSEMSLSAHKRSHRLFECAYCGHRHMLAARIQSHCLIQHPDKPVKYKQCTTTTTEPAVSGGSTTRSANLRHNIKVEAMDSSHTDENNTSGLSDSTGGGNGGDMKRKRPEEVNSSGHGGIKKFHPCDMCPAHFQAESELDRHVSDAHKGGMYVCDHCGIIKWSREDVREHLRDVHPDKPASFEMRRKCSEATTSSTVKSSIDTQDHLLSDNGPPRKMPKLIPSVPQLTADPSSAHGSSTDGRGGGGRGRGGSDVGSYGAEDALAKFLCRLCNYRSGKVTVMRHHAMSHLRYHPYRCPYCDLARSVKSFPITKHVRQRHPGKDIRFNFLRDDKMEAQVKENYYRIDDPTGSGAKTGGGSKPNNTGLNHVNGQDEMNCVKKDDDDDDSDSDDDNDNDGGNKQGNQHGSSLAASDSRINTPISVRSTSIITSSASALAHKVLYRCTFCGLKTHIRTDMRHHLMREIHYKPFKCARCIYTEPCRWSMRKHFRIRHGGAEVEVEDLRDSSKEELVEKMVEECAVNLKDTQDEDLLTWKAKTANPQRGLAYSANVRPPGEYRRDTLGRLIPPRKLRPSSYAPLATTRHVAPIAIAARSKIHSSSLRVGGVPSKTLKMAIKLHRCPHCSYTNTSLKLVRGHMVKHGPYRIQCGYCDYRGHYPSRIRKHTKRHHSGKPFRCRQLKVEEMDVDEEEPEPVVRVVQSSHRTTPQRTSKPPPGMVLLDGVPIDIQMNASADGCYRCEECGYQSTNREHYKMHVVIHRPPKWKCFYCTQKYPVIFRLRRHSHAKHPRRPIKWIDIETGATCCDTNRTPQISASNNNHASSSALSSDHMSNHTATSGSTSKQTGRKSALLTVQHLTEDDMHCTNGVDDNDECNESQDKFVIDEVYTLASAENTEQTDEVLDASDFNDNCELAGDDESGDWVTMPEEYEEDDGC